MNTMRRSVILIFTLIAIIGVIGYLEIQKPRRLDSEIQTIAITPVAPAKNATSSQIVAGKDRSAILKEKKAAYEPAKELSSIQGYINTDPFKLIDLIGKKIILVDFWTYSCINCQRTTPYLNMWHEKYKDKGLVIVGVHTPEFEFEKKYDNVAQAVKEAGIAYPVALDSNYGTWTAYHNLYWPHKYLVDIDGYIAYDHIGEGRYGETEKKIQELLEERKAVLGMNKEISKEISVPAEIIEIDPAMPRSPEIYFGASRNTRLGNGETKRVGIQHLPEPNNIKPHILYLVGDWDIRDEFAENKSKNAKIIFRYQGKNVYMVATQTQNTLPLRVLRDGKPLEVRADGRDIKADALYIGREERLYHIINDQAGWGEHTLEIIIENPGLRVFTFTFG